MWSGQITNRADLLMALGQGEGAREYYAEGRAAAEISRLWAAIERSIKAIRGYGIGFRRHAQAGGVTTPPGLDFKERADPARFSCCVFFKSLSTSLRGAIATKQSILSCCGKMDCFAVRSQ